MSEPSVNREFKDRVFKWIFGNNAKALLSLYNAINHSDYTNVEDLKINTLEDAIYLSMKNDVSFVLLSDLVLFKQQSTYNPNMPLRLFEYCAKLYQQITDNAQDQYGNPMTVYGRRLIKIPTPRCFVLYNGEEDIEDVVPLRLSDAFEKPDTSGAYEWTATLININKGHNKELLDACEMLREYSGFVSSIREHKKEFTINKAIELVMNEYSAHATEFGRLIKDHRTEVMDMFLTEFDAIKYEEGIKAEGKTEEKRDMIMSMFEDGLPVDRIARIAKVTIDYVRQVIGVTV